MKTVLRLPRGVLRALSSSRRVFGSRATSALIAAIGIQACQLPKTALQQRTILLAGSPTKKSPRCNRRCCGSSCSCKRMLQQPKRTMLQPLRMLLGLSRSCQPTA